MEDFVGILVALIVYLIAAASGKKKKGRTQKRQQSQSRRREPGFDQAYSQHEQISMEELARRIAVQHANPAQAGAAAGEDCDSGRIHLHETTAQQLHLAGEGEDPCHVGDVPEPEEPVFSYDDQEAEQSALAQDVLRGVIMSEILTRPCDRAALKRSGRRAV